MFESPLPVTLPPTTDFQHVVEPVVAPAVEAVITHDASPVQIIQNEAPEEAPVSSKPVESSQLPTMSNIPSEPEFEQAYNELASTLENSSLFNKHPEFRTALEVVSVPERVIQFRVVWEDDKGQVRVNRGYRVQFNSALGPYKVSRL
ncbi:hypothetical protein NQ176_g11287 [Zarea fungicola]|uniref:Uncharacterized protein n=1 Tax=Zarea fungicola TaxID=93591 RepID=A0ACC1MCZ3_9HYPO|nr:hypothetical protein NQ176_g11287 [Lecanicillium fungicola]